MAETPITEQQLIDAATDAETLRDVANGAANFGGDGLVHPRLGGNIRTLAKIDADAQETVDSIAETTQTDLNAIKAAATTDRNDIATLKTDATTDRTAIGTLRTNSQTDRDAIATFLAALGDPSAAARLINLENALGLGHTISNAPLIFDDFNGTSANIAGRVTTNGVAWATRTRPGFSSQAASISAGGGFAGGTTGTAAFALIQGPVGASRIEFKIGVAPLPQAGLVLDYTVAESGITDSSGFRIDSPLTTVNNVPSGNFFIRSIVDGGTPVSQQQSGGVRPEVGDTIRFERTVSGGVTQITPFLNGRQFNAPLTISGISGIALNGKHGFIGSAGAQTLDSIKITDRATEGGIGLYAPNRIVAYNVNNDGGATFFLKGDYSGIAPTGLRFTLFDLSSGSPVAVSGLTDILIASYTAAAGLWTGQVALTAPQVSALEAAGNLFFYRVTREGIKDAVSGALRTDFADGPRQSFGYAVGQGGQSLGVESSRQAVTTTYTATAPARTYHVNGEPTSQSVLGNDYDRRQLPVGDNTTAAAYVAALLAGRTSKAAISSGGVSATPIASRKVGTASHTVLIEVLERLGGRLSWIHHTDGQSNIGDDLTAYIADFNSIYDDIAARNGGTIRVGVDPVAASWFSTGVTDFRWQLMRRTHWLLTQQNPSRYFEGANTLDLQHRDQLHLNNETYAEMRRRQAHAVRKMLGIQAHDRNGPLFSGMAKINAETVDCYYDKMGFEALEHINTSFASEFHGGMVFSTASTINSSSIVNKIYPTGSAAQADNAGRFCRRFTFPANTFPGTVFAWACYGHDPFNPTNNAAIQADMAGKASMLRGTISGEPSVGIRPRFSADGNDFLSAS